MKTFAQLTVGDTFYRVYHHQMKYEIKEVSAVSTIEITYGYSSDDKIPRFNTAISDHAEWTRFASQKSLYRYFTSEYDAIRYCKAQMMKNLFNLIEDAKESIEKIKKFRSENYELLNHEWTDLKIRELEKALNQ